MQKLALSAGTFFGGLAVILGAFGAHALKEKLSPDQLQIFETGVRYQFYHAFALIAVSLLANKLSPSHLNYAGILFIMGIFFFSGSIYLLATRELLGIDSWKLVLGPITPLGGLCFVLGWLVLFIGSFKS